MREWKSRSWINRNGSRFNETLHIAIEYNLPLIFTLWEGGFFEELEGVLHYIDEIEKQVHVVDIKEDVHKIKFESIVEVEYKNGNSD